MKGKSGIYKITCTANGKIYIGSAVDFSVRFRKHVFELNKNIHHSIKMQRAWNKYGEECFDFETIENCDLDNLLVREQHYLDTLLFAQEYIRKEDNRFERLGYNICPIAGSVLGRKQSKEERLKRSGENNGFYNKTHSSEFLNRLVEIKTGKKQSIETITKRIKKGKDHYRYGKNVSEDVKLKISNTKLGSIPPNRKIVYSVNMQNGVFDNYPSMYDAAKQFNCRYQNIQYSINANSIYKNHKFFV
jgi:group I intron endonuclease